LVQTRGEEGRDFNEGEGRRKVLIFICLVQGRERKGRGRILIEYMFGTNREGRYFKTKLLCYLYYNIIRVL